MASYANRTIHFASRRLVVSKSQGALSSVPRLFGGGCAHHLGASSSQLRLRGFSSEQASSHTSQSGTSRSSSTRHGWMIGLAASALFLGLSASQFPIRLESFLLGFEDEHVAESANTITDPSTSINFPTTITFKSPKSLPLTLLGVGVRTVSFLGIQVYTCGFYADLSRVDLSHLSSSEEKLAYLIQNKAVAIRLVAVRNTNFSHLRDAYMRALQGRLTLNRKDEKLALSPEQEDETQDSLQQLKATFPPSSLQKKVPFYVWLTPPDEKGSRTLCVPTLKGNVNNTWVGTEFMSYYFAGDGPSPKMKQNVMKRLETV